MTLKEASFKNPRELVAFINTAAIPQAQIVQIVERDGQWTIFFYQ